MSEPDGRHRGPDDDLLTGFDRAGRPQGMRAFFAATLISSLLVWDIAFPLGAYHTVFYSRLFQVLVVSTVLLLGSIALRHRVRVRPWMRLVLSVPLMWLLVRMVASLQDWSGTVRVVDLVMIVVTLLSVPLILWALARILMPEYFEIQATRLKLVAIGIVTLVAVAGFLVGTYNDLFTTCHDYVLAGDNQPANCRVDVTQPRP